MARGLSKYNDKRIPSTFKIQITSMVDMFVIMLVFLLKSYSTSPVNISPNEELKLPTSTTYVDPVDVVKLIVTQKGIFIEDRKVLDFDNGQLKKGETDASDPMFIRALYTELDNQAKVAKNIGEKNENVTFDGKILMQADRSLPYNVLQKVMYTSMLAGYSDLKLAVLSKDF